MKRFFAAVSGFLLAPLAFVWAGWLPPFSIALGLGALAQEAAVDAGPVQVAAPALIGLGLLLAWLFRRAVFARLSAALLVGLVCGVACGALARFHHDAVSANALPFFFSVALMGMVCGFLTHAIFLALVGWMDEDADGRFVFRAVVASELAPWHRPFARCETVLQERHPARLKRVYRPFHLAVTWLFAAAWLAVLWVIWVAIYRYAIFDPWIYLSGLHSAAAAAIGLGTVCAVLVLTACVEWWITSAICVAAAVRSGALPPFGTAIYIRDGTFPTHWIAHEHQLGA